MELNDETNVCLSGGAAGADLKWGEVASARGDEVIHYIFRGHRSTAPEHQKIILSPSQLAEADPHLETANKTLRRRFPGSNDFVNNLLRRNYYQVVWSGSVYAISQIGKDGLVKGGTAWATTMFTDMHPYGKCYVYDQVAKQWFQWKGGWCPIVMPPTPVGVWAGIGSRDLLPAGERAIYELLS